MKKFLLPLLLLCCTLAACGKTAIALPKPEQVVSMEVRAGDLTVTRDDPQYLRDVIEQAADAIPTDRQSNSDTPKQADYVQIELVQQQGSSRLFAYEEQGKFYLEQPYQGIYEIDRALYELIADSPASP